MIHWQLGNGDVLGVSACPAALAEFLTTWFHLTPHPGPATVVLHCHTAPAPLDAPPAPPDAAVIVRPIPPGYTVQLRSRHGYFSVAAASAEGALWLEAAFWQSPLGLHREFFSLVMLWLCKRHGAFLHGSCVADRQGRGILCVGASGSGKSTTAYALTHQGFASVADDVSWLHAVTAGLAVSAFQRGLHLDRRLAAHYPALTQAVAPATPLKDLFRLETVAAQPQASRCRPQVLLFPTVTHQPYTQLQALTPSASLLRLLAHCGAIALQDTYSQMRLTLLQALTRQTRSYALALGGDVYGDAARLTARLLPLLEDSALCA